MRKLMALFTPSKPTIEEIKVESLYDAQANALTHRQLAAHHAALADMYAARAILLDSELNPKEVVVPPSLATAYQNVATFMPRAKG